jgi:hypothetical protein
MKIGKDVPTRLHKFPLTEVDFLRSQKQRANLRNRGVSDWMVEFVVALTATPYEIEVEREVLGRLLNEAANERQQRIVNSEL